MKRPRRTYWFVRAGVFLGVGVLFWCVPPFHIVSLKKARQQSADAAFSAPVFVEKLWNEQLPKAAEQATDAGTLIAAIRKDPKAAREKYGRSGSLGSSYYYFLSGDGRVTAIDSHAISLVIGGGGSTADVVLEMGNIFGNAVRDGTGLVNVSDFANSQDFNAISSEINRRIEERVLPGLKAKAAIGSTVHFAGCAEVSDEDSDLHPLHVVPVAVGVR